MAKKKSVKKLKSFKYDIKKVRLVQRKLILFVILFVASYFLYKVSTNALLNSVLGIASIIFGFVAVAFLLVWLVFFFLKLFGK